jgi:acyl-coenzyme A synthetase/AMP-(fatty) acid ligase
MNVPMAEVEDLVTEISGVTDAACFPVEDATTGERLAVAVRTDGSTDLDLSAIVDALLDAGLAKWKLPEQLTFWEVEFPRTATGKVQRASLAVMSAQRPSILAERLLAKDRNP